ncbi:MAG: hypothetical protein H8E24_16940 [Verrucomicrobia bacterium]|nr:hypothetical protein [Verrucomicrobiota bacterium]
MTFFILMPSKESRGDAGNRRFVFVMAVRDGEGEAVDIEKGCRTCVGREQRLPASGWWKTRSMMKRRRPLRRASHVAFGARPGIS